MLNEPPSFPNMLKSVGTAWMHINAKVASMRCSLALRGRAPRRDLGFGNLLHFAVATMVLNIFAQLVWMANLVQGLKRKTVLMIRVSGLGHHHTKDPHRASVPLPCTGTVANARFVCSSLNVANLILVPAWESEQELIDPLPLNLQNALAFTTFTNYPVLKHCRASLKKVCLVLENQA